jgi:hypothetical protein
MPIARIAQVPGFAVPATVLGFVLCIFIVKAKLCLTAPQKHGRVIPLQTHFEMNTDWILTKRTTSPFEPQYHTLDPSLKTIKYLNLLIGLIPLE